MNELTEKSFSSSCVSKLRFFMHLEILKSQISSYEYASTSSHKINAIINIDKIKNKNLVLSEKKFLKINKKKGRFSP